MTFQMEEWNGSERQVFDVLEPLIVDDEPYDSGLDVWAVAEKEDLWTIGMPYKHYELEENDIAESLLCLWTMLEDTACNPEWETAIACEIEYLEHCLLEILGVREEGYFHYGVHFEEYPCLEVGMLSEIPFRALRSHAAMKWRRRSPIREPIFCYQTPFRNLPTRET